MTREEFNDAVQKLQLDYVPVVKGECVALGYDKIELTCSEEQLATTSNVRVDFGGYPAQWIDLLLRFPKLKSMLFNNCYRQPDNGCAVSNGPIDVRTSYSRIRQGSHCRDERPSIGIGEKPSGKRGYLHTEKVIAFKPNTSYETRR